MTRKKPQDVIDAMDGLLERERVALLHGNLDAIPGLLEQKEALFDQLEALEGTEKNSLYLLQGKVMRNQALLDGALRGIRAVADRMSTLRKVSRSLETYDCEGRRTTIETRPRHKVEKRA